MKRRIEKKIGRDYPMNFSNRPYWGDITKIEILQRRVLVYSLQYYELDESVVSDRYYDEISKQLVWYMQNTDKQVLRETYYYYCMHDFDGSTGFHLKDRLKKYDFIHLMKIAKEVIKSYRKKV